LGGGQGCGSPETCPGKSSARDVANGSLKGNCKNAHHPYLTESMKRDPPTKKKGNQSKGRGPGLTEKKKGGTRKPPQNTAAGGGNFSRK